MTLRISPTEIVRQSQSPLLAAHSSWARVALGDIAEVKNGFAFKSQLFNKIEGMPLVRIRDVGSDSTQTRYLGQYDSAYIVRPGDIVIGMDGDFRVARWRGPEALLNQRVCKVAICDDGFYDENFLLYVLPGYLNAIHNYTSSVTVKHLSSESVKEIPLPLPPLTEQQRIVAAIEEQFSRIDAGVGGLQRARRNLQRMRAAVLQAAVMGRLVPGDAEGEPAEVLVKHILEERRDKWNGDRRRRPYADPAPPIDLDGPPRPEHWAVASLEQLTDPIRVICYGILMPKENVTDGVLYVRVRDIHNGRIDLDGLHRTAPEIAGKYARASLKAGDVLLAIRGTYGRVAIVPPRLEGGNITQDTARLALHPDVEVQYVAHYLSSPSAMKYFNRVARGVAVKGVNIGDVRVMPVPIPPRGEQHRIVRAIQRLMSILEVMEGETDRALRRSSTLRRAVLSQAFAGRLVPQDPSDEPASVLLDRIKLAAHEFAARRPPRTSRR